MFPSLRHSPIEPTPQSGRNGASAQRLTKPSQRIRKNPVTGPISQTRALLAAIVDGSDDAIISKDLEGTILSWNKSAERIFGYRAEEVIGQYISILIPPDRAGEEPEVLRRIRNGERIEHFETVRRRKDGRLLNISLTISPVRDRTGKIVGASKIARDITERKVAERAIEDAQKQLRVHAEGLEERIAERTAKLRETIAELEAFSYSLSHDMRAPLRAIEGFSQTVLTDQGEKLDSRGKELLGKVVTGAQRMDRLILDVLTFTRLSQQPITSELVDLDHLFQEIVSERIEFQAPRAQIEVGSPGTELEFAL